MDKDTTKTLSKIIQIDEVRNHLGESVRGTVEVTLTYY